jgi:hypothetical protein
MTVSNSALAELFKQISDALSNYQDRVIQEGYIDKYRGGYYSKYRGKVVNNLDPLGIGRIRAKVPAVFDSTETSWALPSFACSANSQETLSIPSIGSDVWIEFEAGDPDHPIWTGCFWDVGQTPNRVIQILQ